MLHRNSEEIPKNIIWLYCFLFSCGCHVAVTKNYKHFEVKLLFSVAHDRLASQGLTKRGIKYPLPLLSLGFLLSLRRVSNRDPPTIIIKKM
jgi:hypothetical protein